MQSIKWSLSYFIYFPLGCDAIHLKQRRLANGLSLGVDVEVSDGTHVVALGHVKP